MFQGRRGHHGPQRIDNFGMFAEQQLGTDGLHRYGEHADKYAAAKQQLPGIQVACWGGGGGRGWGDKTRAWFFTNALPPSR